MPIIFLPHDDEMASGSLDQKLEVLHESAERFRAIILDTKNTSTVVVEAGKALTPRDLKHAFNWDELAKILREIRELPESSPSSKLMKSDKLKKLAEVYEILRGAKMAKLEAVRLALINESGQLAGIQK